MRRLAFRRDSSWGSATGALKGRFRSAQGASPGVSDRAKKEWSPEWATQVTQLVYICVGNAMDESQLDAIRRQVREAEARLKESSPTPKPPLSEMKDHELSHPSSPSFSQSERPDPFPHHDQFRDLLENLREALIFVDASGRWELVNQRLVEWLGYTLQEFQALDLGTIFEPADVKALLKMLPQWVGGETPLRQMPVTLRGRNGENVPALLSSHTMIAESGERFACLVFEDVRVV